MIIMQNQHNDICYDHDIHDDDDDGGDDDDDHDDVLFTLDKCQGVRMCLPQGQRHLCVANP